MNPGETTRLVASTLMPAVASPSEPTAVIRSPVMPTSPRNHGAPVPSTTRPLAMITSKRGRCAEGPATSHDEPVTNIEHQ